MSERMKYEEFLSAKGQCGRNSGFEPVFMPDMLFDFQKHLVDWAVRKGRAALLCDCGLGKGFMQLTWAQNVVQKTNGRVLILTPLAVASQTVREGVKFGIESEKSFGEIGSKKIVVTNYEKLHLFEPSDFVGVVCDESSILKHFSGATQQQVTRFMSKIPYRLLCTATPSPNDYIELGTSSQALGELTYSDMLTRFFRQLDDKGQKSEQKKQDIAENIKDSAPQYYQRLAYRVAQTIGQWRLKNYAVDDFWRWVASWAIACRMPSDLGYSDDGFVLPALNQRSHVITPSTPPEGWLFTMPAFGLSEEREERKRTINQRCEFVSQLVNHDQPAVVWCHTNDEGDLLEKLIPDARQVAGATPDDEKEEIYNAFSDCKLRVLVIKPKIGAWGLNWQHCNHVVTFASHSYEQHYQSIRRCWRFGQKREVNLDIIASEGESRIISNMQRKSDQAQRMFEKLVEHMNSATTIKRENKYTNKMEVPKWL